MYVRWHNIVFQACEGRKAHRVAQRNVATLAGVLLQHCRGLTETYTHELEGRDWVLRAVAVCLIGCCVCRGDGSCALGVQVEHMHSALVTGHCHELWDVAS